MPLAIFALSWEPVMQISKLRYLVALLAIGTTYANVSAQDRETKVRGDKDAIEAAGDWIYNDLQKGLDEAKRTGKPLLVVMRCVPCEACAQLDEQVVKRDRRIQELMSNFVAVRLIYTNGMDLSLLQYDYDQSWTALMMNANKTIYGRYGTRSHQTRSEDDISIEGFADALTIALRWHDQYKDNDEIFAAKTGGPLEVEKPEQFPSFNGKFKSELDYEGKVVQSCIHCHMIGEAQRLIYRDQHQAIPDNLLHPYPNPKALGLVMDPRKANAIRKITAGSTGQRDGFKKDDRIVQLDNQPILSTADIQWVLHHTDKDRLETVVERDGKKMELSLSLPEGWRSLDDISWRATSWDLRRMLTGGILLESLDDNARAQIGVKSNEMALLAKHVGQYGEHAYAKNAGVLKDDVIVAFQGRSDNLSESELLTYLASTTKPGDKLSITVLRGKQRLNFEFAAQ